jgi:type VI protein secretion system component VasF
VAVCPADGALAMRLPRRRQLPAWALAAGIAALFLGIVGYAQLSGHWDSPIPDAVYRELIPKAQEFAHP